MWWRYARRASSLCLIAFEKEPMADPADLLLVLGDVTSMMARSIVVKKLKIKVANVEAGIYYSILLCF
jgi:UDP-N-acetylglucosamine 2-epimerase